MVGLIISDITNPFFPEITKVFQDIALASQIDALVMNTNYDPHRTLASVERLISLRVPGVAILTSEIEPGVTSLLAEKGICAAYLDHGIAGPRVSNIKLDYLSGVRSAIAFLQDLGHQSIGFIGGPSGLKSAQVRKEAFLQVVPDESVVVDSDFQVQGGYYACSQLLNRMDATVIFCANDLMAIGALRFAQDSGLKIPSDLSLVGFDNIRLAEYTSPTLTTVGVPRREIGTLAFRALEEMLASEGQTGKEYVLDTKLIIRNSTAEPGRR
jgi:LacI family transcriptional regulator